MLASKPASPASDLRRFDGNTSKILLTLRPLSLGKQVNSFESASNVSTSKSWEQGPENSHKYRENSHSTSNC